MKKIVLSVLACGAIVGLIAFGAYAADITQTATAIDAKIPRSAFYDEVIQQINALKLDLSNAVIRINAGITTNINVLISGGTTQTLQFADGIVTNTPAL